MNVSQYSEQTWFFPIFFVFFFFEEEFDPLFSSIIFYHFLLISTHKASGPDFAWVKFSQWPALLSARLWMRWHLDHSFFYDQPQKRRVSWMPCPPQRMMDYTPLQSIWPVSTWLHCGGKRGHLKTFEPPARSHMNGLRFICRCSISLTWGHRVSASTFDFAPQTGSSAWGLLLRV